jgi:hypothetical protein
MDRRGPAWLLPALILGGLVACGDGGDGRGEEATPASSVGSTAMGSVETTPTIAEGFEEFCGPMEALANYNSDTPQPDTSGDWGAVQQELLEAAGAALPLYDDAVAVAPDDVRTDLEVLRDYSVELISATEQATSVDDLLATMPAPSDEVLTATEELDAYIQENCGFGLTSL